MENFPLFEYITHPITLIFLYLLTGIFYFWFICFINGQVNETVEVNIIIILFWPLLILVQIYLFLRILIKILYIRILIGGTYFAKKKEEKEQ